MKAETEFVREGTIQGVAGEFFLYYSRSEEEPARKREVQCRNKNKRRCERFVRVSVRNRLVRSQGT